MENEIYHHGTKGMRWGIRRYQNKDGTLTPAGRKRYNKELERLKTEEKVLKNRQRTQAKIDKLDEKRRELDDLRNGRTSSGSKTSGKTEKPSVKTMTDDELRSAISRMQLEQEYGRLNPEQVSKGRRFASSVLNNVVAPAATEAGKTVLKELMIKTAKDAMKGSNKPK